MGFRVTTTVIVPALDHDLTTLGVVKDDWGIDGDSSNEFLRRTISRSSKAIENFCNRSFGWETVQDSFYIQRDDYPRFVTGGVEVLQLRRWPVVSLTSVVEQGVLLVEGTDFVTNYATGQLTRLLTDTASPRMWPATDIVAVYSAGYVLPSSVMSNLPPDIEDVASRLVYARYAERFRDPYIKAETVDGVGRVDYVTGGNATSVDGGNLTDDMRDILLNYRVPVIA